jgi:hypothetical protein
MSGVSKQITRATLIISNEIGLRSRKIETTVKEASSNAWGTAKAVAM